MELRGRKAGASGSGPSTALVGMPCESAPQRRRRHPARATRDGNQSSNFTCHTPYEKGRWRLKSASKMSSERVGWVSASSLSASGMQPSQSSTITSKATSPTCIASSVTVSHASGVMPSPPRDAAGASRVCMSYVRFRPTASCEGSTWSLVPIVPRNTPTRHACARRLARRAFVLWDPARHSRLCHYCS